MDELLDLQCGIIPRRQAIEAGLAPHDIKQRLRRYEWGRRPRRGVCRPHRVAVLADAVRGRRTAAARLREALAQRPWAKRRGWLDAVLHDIAELDGRLIHDSARARDSDFDRDLDAAVDGRDSVRLSWGQVFGRACLTARRVGRLLQLRGWHGQPRPCGPECPLAP